MIIDRIINQRFDMFKGGENCDTDNFKEFFPFDESLICQLFEVMKKKLERTNSWDEDSITAAIIDSLIDIFDKDTSHNVNVYKQRGNLENKFGDIAFVITNNLDNGEVINGVSFIEAKRDFPENNYRFNSFKKAQMERFLLNTNSSYYLFYSHHSFLPIADTRYLNQIVNKKYIRDGNLELEDLIYMQYSFFSQISRFLQGYDLDYTKESIIIAEGKNDNLGKAKYIIQIEKFGEGEHPEPTPSPDGTPPFKPDLNRYKKYTKESTIKIENDIEHKNDNGGFGMGMGM